MSKPVVVVGLGQMGGAMAERLRESGMDVIGYDISAAVCEHFRGKGMHIADSLEAALADAERFREGIYFRHEDLRTRPATLEVLGPRLALLTLCEGRYHQVKRMFGSFRNPVLALHRESVGPLRLDESLAPGQYRDLDAAEVACLRGQAPSDTGPAT